MIYRVDMEVFDREKSTLSAATGRFQGAGVDGITT